MKRFIVFGFPYHEDQARTLFGMEVFSSPEIEDFEILYRRG